MDAQLVAALTWMRTRPPAVQDCLRAFPPVCRVVVHDDAGADLRIVFGTQVQRVIAYSEQDEGVMIRVMAEDAWFNVPMGTHIRDSPGILVSPRHFRVVQYDGNKTPEWVGRVLAGEDVAATNPGLDGKIDGPMAA